MEHYVSAQLRELFTSMALGTAAALIYDVLRSARLLDRGDHFLTHLLDAFFVTTLAVGTLFLSFSLGQGQLRLYMLTGAALGAVVWFALFSKLLRPVWEIWCAALVAAVQLLLKPVVFLWNLLQKGLFTAKKGFSFLYTWGKMKYHHTEEEGSPMAAKSTKAKNRKKTSPLLLLVLVVLIVVLAVQVANVYGDLADVRRQEASLNEALSQQQQENDALRSDLEKKDDENFIKALARELLGLAEEGERIFYDVNE
ncbi:MAG: septum formation initiator family protein [Oscillospiraceae bacterium]|nr:septum formation initiator family protein [Oscillospiraceae bacterium]